MIEVKLEDFEKMRPNLLRYATGLLKTRGFYNNKFPELEHLAKDIVQNCYLVFHKHHKDPFESWFHLESFTKICLYNQYRYITNIKCGIGKFTELKEGNITILKESKVPVIDGADFENRDIIYVLKSNEDFRKNLNTRQLLVLDSLLCGWTQVELAKELGISRQAIAGTLSIIKDKYYRFVH